MIKENIRIIYEMANNHMGDVRHGINIIRELKKVSNPFKYDFAVKFQFRELDTFIHPDFKGSDLKFVKRFEETVLKESEWQQLIKETKSNNFKTITTPFDEDSVLKAMKMDIDIIKIASCSLSDWPLLEAIAKVDNEIIFSTAGADLDDIDNMVAFFRNRNKKFTLMHCVGKYPTPNNELGIGQINFFRERYNDINIGYSTHEDPNNLSAVGLAFSMGANTFEKHVGIKTEKYNINDYSATPEQISLWLKSLDESISMVGNRDDKAINTEEEKSSLKDLQRGVFVKKDIKAGEKIKLDDVIFSIPVNKNGFTANDFSKYSEFTALKDIKKLEAVNNDNTKLVNLRNDVLDIVKKVRNIIKDTNLIIPNGSQMEISHHYGIEDFYNNGLIMFTIINKEYCKKILILLKNQTHPAQFHKIKRETFHVLHGELDLFLDDVKKNVGVGEVITIEPNVVHKFSTKTGCVVEEISSNHKIDDSFYLDKQISENINRKTLVNFWR